MLRLFNGMINRAARGRFSAAHLTPLALAGGMFFYATDEIAFQDAASLIALEYDASSRWTAHLRASPHGSTHEATLATQAPRTVMPDEDAGIATAALGEDGDSLVVLPGAGGGAESPLLRHADQSPVVVKRSGKADLEGSRVTRRTPVREHEFESGIIGEMESVLSAGPMLGEMAFVQPERMPIEDIVGPAMAIGQNKPDMPDTVLAMAPTGRDAEPEPEERRGAISGRGETTQMAMTIPLPRERVTPPEDMSFDERAVWAEQAIEAGGDRSKSMKCLTEAIYYEARSEPETGQVAVGQVVLNRVHSTFYPNNVCAVVYQNRHMRNRCQFSFACDGTRLRVTERRAWAKAEDIAEGVAKGDRWMERVGKSTHYHATYVRPRWVRDMVKMQRIGKHIFYQVRAWMSDT